MNRRRFSKALAFAIGIEAMLLGCLFALQSAWANVLQVLEALLYLIGSLAALTWCFYEWNGDEKDKK